VPLPQRREGRPVVWPSWYGIIRLAIRNNHLPALPARNEAMHVCCRSCVFVGRLGTCLCLAAGCGDACELDRSSSVVANG